MTEFEQYVREELKKIEEKVDDNTIKTVRLETKFDELPQGDIKESQADISLAKKMINWSYKTSIEDGLENFFF